MPTATIEIPDALRARWTDVPRLAWVMSLAFGVHRRHGSGGTLRALPSTIVIHLPVVAAATLTRHAATDKNRTAVMIVYPDRRTRLAFVLTATLWLGALAAVAGLAADRVLAGAETFPQLSVRIIALLAVYVLVLFPVVVDLAAMLTRAAQPDARHTLRYAAQLRRTGTPCAAISAWAAWPRHRGAGRRLADDLLHHLPAEARLVATARDATVARWLHDRGFALTSQGLLMERSGGPQPPS